jgi:hypothetical protein
VKWCYRCGKTKKLDQFHKTRRGACRPCHSEISMEWQKKHKGRMRAYMFRHALKRKYGITVDIYLELFRKQGFGCAICKKPCSSGRVLAVDHDHISGVIRGLLCRRCNIGLGNFQDDPVLLSTAAGYLQTAKLQAGSPMPYNGFVAKVPPQGD